MRFRARTGMSLFEAVAAVAIVGATGSGKTTIIKLLSRLYDPQHGLITLDGIDLRQYRTTALRRAISVMLSPSSGESMKLCPGLLNGRSAVGRSLDTQNGS